MDLRSSLPDIVFPALLGGQAAELAALLRQFDASQHWPLPRIEAAQAAQLRHVLARP